MVKDAGLACRFVISKKPQGCPVTERLDITYRSRLSLCVRRTTEKAKDLFCEILGTTISELPNLYIHLLIYVIAEENKLL